MNENYLMFPVKKYIGIAQGFKPTHRANDYGWNLNYAEKDQPVIAPKTMTVLMNSIAETTGYFIVAKAYKDENSDYIFRFLHFDSKPNLKVGQEVKQGVQFSKVGQKGAGSEGFHLHFELWIVPKNYAFNFNDREKYAVPPTDYLYAYPEQIVGDVTQTKYNIKHYTPTDITPPVERDETKDQLLTNTTLNVRIGAGTNFESIGTIKAGNLYNYYEIVENDGYKWFKIADNQWLAQDEANTYLTIYSKEEYEKIMEELKKEIAALKLRVAELEKDIINKDKLILEKNVKIKELEDRNWFSMFVDWIKGLFSKKDKK